jgi:hypothetical protein
LPWFYSFEDDLTGCVQEFFALDDLLPDAMVNFKDCPHPEQH